MPTLTAARVVTPDGVLEPGAVEIEEGTIVAVAPTRGPVAARVLAPGFIDLQVNGHDDVDVATAEGADWERLDGLLLDQGVTTWCPTLVTAPLDRYAAPLARIAAAAGRPGPRPAVAGAHLEGPFLGAVHGVHDAAHVAPVDQDWLAGLDPVVRVVTLGPETPGAARAAAALAARGVLVAMGHSAATHAQAAAVAEAGARLVTHCFNAMAPLHHREPGLAGLALADPALAVSVIADLVHVHPAVLSVVHRCKARGRLVAVTDAVAWRSPAAVDAGVRRDGPAARRADGTLAGTAIGMDRAVANLARDAGAGLLDAVWAAATAPAALLGLGDRGRIAAGARADLVALDDDLRAGGVWVSGERLR